jgi:hypothetical protein
MIVPQKELSKNRVKTSAGVTAGFLLFGYLTLLIVNVPKPELNRDLVREITELRITPELPKMETPVEPTSENAANEIVSPVEQAVQAPQRVDLSTVLPQGLQVDLSVNRSASNSATNSNEQSPSESRSLRLEESDLSNLGGLQTLRDRALSTPVGAGRTPGSQQSGGSSIGMAQGSSGTGQGAGLSGSAGLEGLSAGVRAREGNQAGRQVGLKNLDDFGDNYEDFSPFFRQLIDWMKKNPARLPIPVQRLMADGNWDPSYLSSRAGFTVNNRSFDLLLMCKEELFEVHIMLVENTNATYLIDRDFQKRSNSLRVGGVGVRDGDISEVGSQLRPAGEDRNREFYQIFLSWWESVSKES